LRKFEAHGAKSGDGDAQGFILALRHVSSSGKRHGEWFGQRLMFRLLVRCG
jgi:hypothetical protein